MPPDEEVPLLAVRRSGEGFVAQGVHAARFGHPVPDPDSAIPDGCYAGWSWDAQTGLTVETDRLGMQPLYYALGPGSIMLSPSVPALIRAGVPDDLDLEALSVILRCGYAPGDDTLFAAVRRFPPRAEVRWTGRAFEVSGRADPVRQHSLSFDATMDAFIDALRGAVRRRLALCGRFVLPLSGGKDSRLLGALLAETGAVPAHSITLAHWPPRNQQDLAFGTQAARALGFPHETLAQPRRIAGNLVLGFHLTSFATPEHGWYVPLRKRLAAIGLPTFDGLGGDLVAGGLSQSAELSRLMREDVDGAARACAGLRRGYCLGDEGVAALVAPRLRPKLTRAVAEARIAREIRKVADWPNPTLRFFIMNRMRKGIAPGAFGVLGVVPSHMPYLDRRICDLMQATPEAYLFDHQFRQKAIARVRPDLAAIPYEGGVPGLWRGYDAGRERWFAIDALRRVVSQRSRVIDRPAALRRLAETAVRGNDRTAHWWGPRLALFLLEAEGLRR